MDGTPEVFPRSACTGRSLLPLQNTPTVRTQLYLQTGLVVIGPRNRFNPRIEFRARKKRLDRVRRVDALIILVHIVIRFQISHALDSAHTDIKPISTSGDKQRRQV